MKVFYDTQFFFSQLYGGVLRYFVALMHNYESSAYVEVPLLMLVLNNDQITALQKVDAQSFLPEDTFPGKQFIEQLLNRFSALALKARRMIAVRQNTKQDVIRLFAKSEQKVEIIPIENTLPAMAILVVHKGYFIFAGKKNGYQNFTNVISTINTVLRNKQVPVYGCSVVNFYHNTPVFVFQPLYEKMCIRMKKTLVSIAVLFMHAVLKKLRINPSDFPCILRYRKTEILFKGYFIAIFPSNGETLCYRKGFN